MQRRQRLTRYRPPPQPHLAAVEASVSEEVQPLLPLYRLSCISHLQKQRKLTGLSVVSSQGLKPVELQVPYKGQLNR